ncbi:MAG: hypothetical protein LBG48_00560 [Rickettsiales bacterium]|nr:hypothetical protein [Rickettsiales bacterium]
MVFRITLLCLGLFSVIAELEFLNERSEFRNSSSAIQVTNEDKNTILYFVINYYPGLRLNVL